MLLAAGKGTRLRPLTDKWPKCLMPIGERPLLEYWLENLLSLGISKVLVNMHHHADDVRTFLRRSRFVNWVEGVFEPELLGTAGTLISNSYFFKNCTTLLVHADNWCQCDFEDFLNFHQYRLPSQCLITMMTFDSPSPETCGIVEVDEQGVVQTIHEKSANANGTCANGAVYLLKPEVLSWLEHHPEITDFSTEVLPRFMGRIAIWHNYKILRDIGTSKMLKIAQSDPTTSPLWPKNDLWQKKFMKHPIHKLISDSLL